MKSRIWSLTAASIFLAAFTLPPATVATRAGGDESLRTLAATQSSKHKRMSVERAIATVCPGTRFHPLSAGTFMTIA
jgi:hypothetical protein